MKFAVATLLLLPLSAHSQRTWGMGIPDYTIFPGKELLLFNYTLSPCKSPEKTRDDNLPPNPNSTRTLINSLRVRLRQPLLVYGLRRSLRQL